MAKLLPFQISLWLPPVALVGNVASGSVYESHSCHMGRESLQLPLTLCWWMPVICFSRHSSGTGVVALRCYGECIITHGWRCAYVVLLSLSCAEVCVAMVETCSEVAYAVNHYLVTVELQNARQNCLSADPFRNFYIFVTVKHNVQKWWLFLFFLCDDKLDVCVDAIQNLWK